MKKKRIIILITVLTIAGITAFGFTKNKIYKKLNNPIPAIDSNSVTKELSDFGISNGINIDYRTGKATQFTSSKPELSYMVVRGSFIPNSIGKTGRAITEAKLRGAQTIGDVIENYPSNWITSYNSVTILTKINDQTFEATGPNDKLTKEQKEILRTATHVSLVVNYQKANNKNEIQNREMKASLIVTPEREAEYVGGFENLISYLKENSLREINAKNFMHLPQPTISFIINKEGKAEKVTLEATSKNEEIDQLLMNLIKDMPKWNPAKNKDGVKIKQDFVFSVGQDGC